MTDCCHVCSKLYTDSLRCINAIHGQKCSHIGTHWYNLKLECCLLLDVGKDLNRCVPYIFMYLEDISWQSPTMNYNCIELYHHKIMLINVALHVLIYRYWPKAIHSAVDYWTYQSTKVHLNLISQQFIKFINIFQDSSWRIIPISTVSSWQPPFVSHVGLIGRAPITHPFSASDRRASKVTWQKL